MTKTSNISFQVSQVFEVYNSIKDKIENRLKEFEKTGKEGSDYKLFEELVFCLLTPQTKALDCDKALKDLKKREILYKGSREEISKAINYIRFKNNKAKYIVNAREKFFKDGVPSLKNYLNSTKDEKKLREKLVKEIKGLGLKEASHFLRNIGKGNELAIIDRHILKCALKYKIIKNIPRTITKKTYLRLEKKLKKFSFKTKIPLSHLDLLFWYIEKGYFFK